MTLYWGPGIIVIPAQAGHTGKRVTWLSRKETERFQHFQIGMSIVPFQIFSLMCIRNYCPGPPRTPMMNRVSLALLCVAEKERGSSCQFADFPEIMLNPVHQVTQRPGPDPPFGRPGVCLTASVGLIPSGKWSILASVLYFENWNTGSVSGFVNDTYCS